jgi:hypothetical protein
MEKEKITPWVEKMNAEADGKKRNEIVASMCKEHGLKIGDAWKLLKEAGFEPKGSSRDNPQDRQQEGEAKEQKKPVVLRHKTEYQKYRCAGLVLTQKPETYEVTEAQEKKLKKDPWVEVLKDKEVTA